jgi:polysaccharide export outer membrane protein
MKPILLAPILALAVAGCRSRGVAPAPRVAAPSPPRAAPATASPSITTAQPTSAAARPIRFHFQVGDEMGIDVWQEKELSTQQRILPDGTVSPPLVGTVDVTGRSVDEVRELLTRRYAEYLKDPKVSVRVVGIHSDRVFVLGEVEDAQAVPIHGPTTMLQAIAMAGGFEQEFADRSQVRLVRRGPDGCAVSQVVNTDAILCGRGRDVPLQRGDIVYVPPRGVTNWSRTVGQALSPLAIALGSAGAVAAVVSATN